MIKTLLSLTLALSLASASPSNAQPQERSSFIPVESAENCPADRSPIMILGTYHMNNPGLDAVNTQADDVLLERRQREIAELIGRLARFRPTKVMLEAAYASPIQQQRYEQYLAGTYQLSRNEIDQIGFRLARQMGLARVNPVDFPMWMSGQTYDELEFRPRPAPSADAPPASPRELTEAERLLRASTVAEYLAHMNRPGEWHDRNHLLYMDMFEPDPDNVSIYAKIDPLTNWYKRNFRIWANVVRKTERPRDRVFLLIGAGHLAILRRLALDMPGFCLVEPARYLTAD